MKKLTVGQFVRSLLLGLAFVLVSHGSLSANVIFTWSGLPIVGERPDFLPSGSAEFQVVQQVGGDQLVITLTNDTVQEILAIGEVLIGLTWGITTGSGITLTPGSAMIAPGSQLVNPPEGYDMSSDFMDDIDLSTEWAFRDDIDAPSFGSFGIGAMGDVLYVGTFGPYDLFNTGGGIFPSPESPDGIDGGIVGPNVDFTADGFTSQGPVVQGHGSTTAAGQMIFSLNITSGALFEDDITNVQPLFGTDGAPLVPEPTTMLLLGSGLVSLAMAGMRRRKSRL